MTAIGEPAHNGTTFNTHGIKRLMASLFSSIFLALSVAMGGLAIYEFSHAFMTDASLATGLVKAINSAIVSLAIFELGLGIGKEYSNVNGESDDNILSVVRRSTTRFVAVVCVALVLEGLIMVIKYSQLELAGNLYYPVAIIVAAAILLLSLGGFLKLTAGIYCEGRPLSPTEAEMSPSPVTPVTVSRTPSL